MCFFDYIIFSHRQEIGTIILHITKLILNYFPQILRNQFYVRNKDKNFFSSQPGTLFPLQTYTAFCLSVKISKYKVITEMI